MKRKTEMNDLINPKMYNDIGEVNSLLLYHLLF
jgi:hypothetical protein